ncbi:MAG: hypothetical protein M3Z25_14945 [Actinomycetota bacterium]|nr:hypothetical protein [Actinomycetota bacterium]
MDFGPLLDGLDMDEVGKTAALLAGVATDLNEINIPNVAPGFTSIAGIEVISGLDYGSNRLLERPAHSLSEGADLHRGGRPGPRYGRSPTSSARSVTPSTASATSLLERLSRACRRIACSAPVPGARLKNLFAEAVSNRSAAVSGTS